MCATYQVKGEIVDLVECLAADVTLECFLVVVRQFVIFVVALLVESFATILALVRLVSGMDSDMGVEGRAPVECLAAKLTLVWLLRGVDDLVPAQGRGLSESFSANLADKWPGPGVNRHVSGEVVVGVEHLAALRTGECFARLLL